MAWYFSHAEQGYGNGCVTLVGCAVHTGLRYLPQCHAVQGYGNGCVTLVGDAVHMGPPNGLGVNLAMEDAAILGHHLRESGLTPEALRR